MRHVQQVSTRISARTGSNPRDNVALVQLTLILFLAFWMAVFAPAICQFHGLMLRFGNNSDTAASTQHQHHIESGMDMDKDMSMPAEMDSQANSDPRSEPLGATLYRHEPASTTTMIFMLFVVIVPGQIALQYQSNTDQILPSNTPLPLQRTIPPPDQPPRFV
jgi:hypothetical protein